MSAYSEVQRTDRTGTIWFAATLLAAALVVGALIVSGWRPSQLEGSAEDIWWIGFTFTSFGLAGLGYAGCPIYWGNVEVAHKQKSVSIRAGLVLYLLGSVISVAALLLGS